MTSSHDVVDRTPAAERVESSMESLTSCSGQLVSKRMHDMHTRNKSTVGSVSLGYVGDLALCTTVPYPSCPTKYASVRITCFTVLVSVPIVLRFLQYTRR